MSAEDNSHIKIGLRIRKSEENPLGWKYVDSLPTNKAYVIALPGSNTDNSKKANGFAKMIEEVLTKHPLPIYSVEYERAERNFRVDREALLAKYGQEDKQGNFIKQIKEEDIDYIPQYIRELYTQTIAPRLRGKTTQRLPIATVAQQLNQLVFINHCQGSTVFLQLERLAKEDMKQLGYSEKISTYLLKQLHSINVAPVTPYGITQTTSFKFMSLDDDIAMSVHTPKIQHVLHRKKEHQRFIEGLNGNKTERLSSNKAFVMQFSMFRPTENETIFAVNNMYPTEIQQDEKYQGIEHTFAPYSDEEDTDRTKQGDIISRMFQMTTNWLAQHAKTNETELCELPDITQTPRFLFYIKQAQKNRYQFITKETALLKAQRPKNVR